MSFKLNAMILFLCVLMLVLCENLFATDPVSFSLYHQVNVDASLEYKFLDAQGHGISNKSLAAGSNEVGGFYATFNTTRKVNVELVWSPLIREDEQVASEDTVYPYTMIITDSSGSVLPSFASAEAGVSAGSHEYTVNGEYGSGQAFFLNKWLTRTSSTSFETSLICSMTISIAENDSLPPGTYSGTICFIVLGS